MTRNAIARLPLAAVACAVACAVALIAAGCSSPPKPLPAASEPVAGSAPGPTYGATGNGTYAWTDRLQAARDQLERKLNGSPVTVVRSTDNRLWITLPGDFAFDSNRSALKLPGRAVLDQVALAARGLQQPEIRIVGHTDAKGSGSGNNALSLDRAASARDWLVARGLSPVRMSVAGRGAQDPIASNDNDSGRAVNRRVEVLIGERAAGATPPAGR